MLHRIIAITGAAWLLLATAAAAQTTAGTATLTGIVQREAGGQPVAGAAVLLPQLGRETSTDANGAFRFERLPAGTVQVVVRSVGFTPRIDTVTLVAGRTTSRTFVIGTRVTQLDSVQVTATERRYTSPALRGFEERRRAGGGRYLAEDDLRRLDGKRLSNVISSRITGIRAVPMGGATYLASSRSSSSASGLAFQRQRGQEGRCYVNVYMDGMLIYDGAAPGARPLDFDRLSTQDFAGIEYYSGGATIPPQFNRTSSGCGVLLLWSRER